MTQEMPPLTSPCTGADGHQIEAYRPLARSFHWLTVLLLAIQFPVGLVMVYRGPGRNVWDGVTNTLYAGHKATGVLILGLVLLRLFNRLIAGTPPPASTLPGWQKAISTLNHWSLYLLLIIVPALGYLAVCYFPALTIVGFVTLPAIVAPDRMLYGPVIHWHAIGAGVLAGLITVHVSAALYHRLIRRDNVLARMLPSAPNQGDNCNV